MTVNKNNSRIYVFIWIFRSGFRSLWSTRTKINLKPRDVIDLRNRKSVSLDSYHSSFNFSFDWSSKQQWTCLDFFDSISCRNLNIFRVFIYIICYWNQNFRSNYTNWWNFILNCLGFFRIFSNSIKKRLTFSSIIEFSIFYDQFSSDQTFCDY